MTRLRHVAVTGIVLAGMLATGAAAEVYRWTDGSGRVHFSSNPPAGGKAQRLDLRPSTPDPAGKPPARSWQDQVQQANELRHQGRQQQRHEQEQARSALEAERKCQVARRNLEVLERDRPVYRTNAQGEREYLEDEQRPAALDAAQQKVAASCP